MLLGINAQMGGLGQGSVERRFVHCPCFSLSADKKNLFLIWFGKSSSLWMPTSFEDTF